jgi:hypothetical protein
MAEYSYDRGIVICEHCGKEFIVKDQTDGKTET